MAKIQLKFSSSIEFFNIVPQYSGWKISLNAKEVRFKVLCESLLKIQEVKSGYEKVLNQVDI